MNSETSSRQITTIYPDAKECAGFLGFTALIAVWLMLNASIETQAAIKAVSLLALGAAPILLTLRRIIGRIGLAESAASFAAGFVLSGIVSIIVRVAGMPNWLTPAVFAALTIALLVDASYRKKEISVPGQIQAASLPRYSLSLSGIFAALISILPLSVVLVRGALAGRGDFPSLIFYSDDAVDLATIRSLLATPSLPPHSLTFYEGIKPYHFGVLEAVANLVRFSGIKTHIAQFYVAFPVLESGIIGASWLILRRLPRGIPLLLGACLLTTALNQSQGEFHISFKVFQSLRNAFGGDGFAAEPTLRFLIVHLPTTGARLFSWLAFALLFYWENKGARWLAATLIGTLAPIDPFYFVSMGLILGVWCLYHSWVKRSIWPILPAAGAFCIGLLLMHLIGSGDSGFRIVFAPFSSDYCTENTIEMVHNFALFVILGAILATLNWRRILALDVVYLVSGLLLLLTVNLTVLIYANQDDANFNWFRLTSPLPMLITSFVTLMAARSWQDLHRILRLIVIAVVLIGTSTQLLRMPVTAAQVVADPHRGDDVTDTAALGEAMEHIPVQGSLIVTNDLRYPVIDYRYTKKNPLVSALFGHQCYFCNGDAEAELPGADQRQKEIAHLNDQNWSPAISELAAHNHWTHLLVHKVWAHAADIPLQLVFENSQYAVYAF